jgi:alpha-ribazole phosphatase/probable phosphoglycerate mutase
MIRHGEIPSNVHKVYAGRSPEPLTEKGLQQAREVSESLKGLKVDALYSSPIQRALQTARIVSEATGTSLKVEDAFRELEMGPWEGMSEAEIAMEYPEEWNIWNSDPAKLRLEGRETLDLLLKRVLTGVRNIYKDLLGGKVVIIVTHVAIIRVLLLWHERKSLNLYKTIHVPNAEIFEMKIDSEAFL